MSNLVPRFASLSGFIDYSFCFPETSVLWTALGAFIAIGSCISLIPQIVNINKRNSSFGLNPISIFVTSFSQFILLTNVLCMHVFDFVGVFQFPIIQSIPRYLTFAVTFVLWFFYLPIPFLNVIFFDLNFRVKRQDDKIKREKLFGEFIIVFLPISAFVFLLIFLVGGLLHGFNSKFIVVYGGTCGTVSTVIGFAQYLPQMITTIRLQDPGSLSLMLLLMQAPGGLANALFLWFGQGDHWSTWISILSAAIQQFILIAIILYFKFKKWRIRKMFGEYQSFEDNSVNSVNTANSFHVKNEFIQKPTIIFT
ncbi:PQ loop repeat family protein [Tritrichomonas foetus]|uniref:PQ loop repeat family protein n=1 Tax=Tritrichomonas foetus TaxID=1144522 RepID=A0A1J4KLE1_9EUKA|nr:PQ loop repeat family protein [Tritrichomonas foetus]|eukprot:OHT10612.1 PQ loop repeat family protein [Tritrichomonas foetus]